MDFLALLREFAPRNAQEARSQTRLTQFVTRWQNAAFGREIVGEGRFPGHITSAAHLENCAGTRVLLVFGAKEGAWKRPGAHVANASELREVAAREACRALNGAASAADGAIHALHCREIGEYWNTPAHTHFEVVWRFVGDETGELPRGARWFERNEAEARLACDGD